MFALILQFHLLNTSERDPTWTGCRRSWCEPARTEASVVQLSHKDTFISFRCYMNTPICRHVRLGAVAASSTRQTEAFTLLSSTFNLRSVQIWGLRKNDSACSLETVQCFTRDPGKKKHSEVLCIVRKTSQALISFLLESMWLLCCHTCILIFCITGSSNLEGKC